MIILLYILLVIGILSLVLWRLFHHLATNERRNTRFQNDVLRRHYEEVENMYAKMRGWRHDYHNHIQSMKAYLAFGQLDELTRYLNDLDQELTTVDTLIKTGNVRLDAVLNSKLSLIRNESIRVKADAHVPATLTINAFDLSSIVGNLLDNARDSCLALTKTDDRFIRIYIGTLKAQLYISVTNATAANKRRSDYHSTKGSGHGFGLRRIDATVRKYNGYVNRQNEPGVFATEIMLPL
ncbi:MAG: GHKL domain-containing protein [Sporolactobacillus sp.]